MMAWDQTLLLSILSAATIVTVLLSQATDVLRKVAGLITAWNEVKHSRSVRIDKDREPR